MKLLKVFLTSIFLFVMIILPMEKSEAYVTMKYKSVPLSVAQIRLPEESYILELDLGSFVKHYNEDENLQKEVKKAFDSIISKTTNPTEQKYYQNLYNIFNDKNFMSILEAMSIYQVGLFDGSSNHSAMILTMKNNDLFTDIVKPYVQDPNYLYNIFNDSKFRSELIDILRNVLKTDEIIFLNGKITNNEIHKVLYNNIEKSTFELLDVSEFKTMQIGKKPAFSMDLRFAGELSGVFSSGYTKLLFFENKKNTNLIVFFSSDSEREFWSPIFTKIIEDGIKIRK